MFKKNKLILILMTNKLIKAAFFVTLLLTVIMGITFLTLPVENNVVNQNVDSSYSGSLIPSNDPNYDVYNRDFDESNSETDPVKVYYMFKDEGMVEVVKLIDGKCGGN